MRDVVDEAGDAWDDWRGGRDIRGTIAVLEGDRLRGNACGCHEVIREANRNALTVR